MPINFDAAFGIHEKALLYRGERSAVIANNIANADTPNFKARDLTFMDALRSQTMTQQNLFTTDAQHIASEDAPLSGSLLYEIPTQPNIDGNTVETHIEQAKFAENALQYQASLTFLNGKMKSLMSAIRGD